MKLVKLSLIAVFVILLLSTREASASVYDGYEYLYEAASPYIRYFADAAMGASSGFGGLTRSYRLYLGGQSEADQSIIEHGAAAYDQTMLGMLQLYNGQTTILDTYVGYAAQLANTYNPLLNTNGNYYDLSGALNNGTYRFVRIDGRDSSHGEWYKTWDWGIDIGAAACLMEYAIAAYEMTPDEDYRDFAVLLGEYILKLQDTDGGVRYGPMGQPYGGSASSDYYWKLKSTEQNERARLAMEGLYSITSDARYGAAADGIGDWLVSMYDPTEHLYHSSAIYDAGAWYNADFSYIATDVMAFAPLDLMFSDAAFGATQELRNAEVDAMFATIEERTAYRDSEGNSVFFKFSVSQTTDPAKGGYGSVEWSSQMALAYLEAAGHYLAQGNAAKWQAYLDKYNALMSSLALYFSAPSDDPIALVAPYASYYSDRSVAGGVTTGTGYYTFNCSAALASAYYALALTEGFKPRSYSYDTHGNLTVSLYNGTTAYFANDLIADFGTFGLWKYSSGSWSQLSGADADSYMLTDVSNGVYDAIADFGAMGLWKYSSGSWTQLSGANTESFLLSKMASGSYDVIADFGSSGFWKYSGSTWSMLSAGDVEYFGLSGTYNSTYDAIADFGTGGLWKYSSSTWSQLSGANAESFVLSDVYNNSYDIITDFGSAGLWRYSGSSWTQLSAANAETYMLSGLNGGSYDVIADFGTSGLWRYSSSTWSQLSGGNADSFGLSDLYGGSYDVIADFGSSGFWKYSGSTWTMLSGANASGFMITSTHSGSYDVIADFGLAGLWKYSGSAWTNISSSSTRSFIITNSKTDGTYDIIADFGTSGIWKYSSGAWTQLSAAEVDPEVSQRLDVQNRLRIYGKSSEGGYSSTTQLVGAPTRAA